MSTGKVGYGKELNYLGYRGQCMVGRVSYLGRVKQGNYNTHVLYTIPNPNYTLPKPYPFIITYPIRHPTLGTQTGRVLPCASINTTLPWIPTYSYPFQTKNELRLCCFEGRMWDLIVSSPDHCLSCYFAYQSSCGCAVWWP